jgi:cell division septum initiation protein DivIVA
MNLVPKALTLGCCLSLGVLLGCSSGLEGVQKRLSSMQDEITRLQNQNDRLVERVDAMEVREAKTPPAGKARLAAPSSAAASERPSLKVVKVVPEDTSGMPSPQVGTQAPGDAADDPSPRPVIKLRGSGKSAEKSEGKGEG